MEVLIFINQETNSDSCPVLNRRIESVKKDTRCVAISAWLAMRNTQETIRTSEQLRAQALGGFALCVSKQDAFARTAVINSPWLPETASLQTAT